MAVLIEIDSLYSSMSRWRSEEYGAQAAIELQAITVGHSNDSILQDIDLTVYHKDCFGIVGPLGSGKTTLLRLVLGLVSPSAGRVRIFGARPSSRLRRRLPVSYLPQFSPIPEDTPATVWNYVCMGALGSRGLFRSFPKENALYAENLLVALHLDHRIKSPVGHLSPGQQQGIRIVRAMVSFPRLLVLDEPFHSIDPQGRELVVRLLADLRRRVNTTILIASQDGKPLSSICRHIACLNHSLLWVAARRDIDDSVWDDPCRNFPLRDGEWLEDESEQAYARSETRMRNHPASHAIQFWR